MQRQLIYPPFSSLHFRRCVPRVNDDSIGLYVTLIYPDTCNSHPKSWNSRKPWHKRSKLCLAVHARMLTLVSWVPSSENSLHSSSTSFSTPSVRPLHAWSHVSLAYFSFYTLGIRTWYSLPFSHFFSFFCLSPLLSVSFVLFLVLSSPGARVLFAPPPTLKRVLHRAWLKVTDSHTHTHTIGTCSPVHCSVVPVLHSSLTEIRVCTRRTADVSSVSFARNEIFRVRERWMTAPPCGVNTGFQGKTWRIEVVQRATGAARFSRLNLASRVLDQKSRQRRALDCSAWKMIVGSLVWKGWIVFECRYRESCMYVDYTREMQKDLNFQAARDSKNALRFFTSFWRRGIGLSFVIADKSDETCSCGNCFCTIVFRWLS